MQQQNFANITSEKIDNETNIDINRGPKYNRLNNENNLIFI